MDTGVDFVARREPSRDWEKEVWRVDAAKKRAAPHSTEPLGVEIEIC